MNPRKVALTGIKPTGTPHLGNLFGAILPAIELTKSYRGFYFIADYHALTTEKDGATLRDNVEQVAATWIALGLDHENHVFFQQSRVPEVCELSWILSCFTGMGLLSRAHAYKDAVQNKKEANHGLFAYPVLMAADILLYETNVVPVGKDQKQHVEMCREMAGSVNHAWGEGTLIAPEPLIQEEGATVTGLDGRKMSKSYDNAIEIFLPAKKLRKRFMKIVTGSEGLEDSKNPDDCNVMKLYRLLAAPSEVEEMAELYRRGGFGYGAAKERLFETYEAFIGPKRTHFDELLADRAELRRLIDRGTDAAREVATKVLDRVRERAGLT